ncbi:MAG TPA: hypothetical protein P5050_06430 [Bacteroidia bacterium]|nr:hypothetical protein [Bacteroidia bacterium]HRS58842.1 hypothetical protein [Bacteroidia bacterium]HRU67726.1 hypothetical protein [Bacteroidia bacterium]
MTERQEYQSDKITIRDKQTGQPVEIHPEGSLGLLALGAVGVKAWREARKKARQNSNMSEKGTEKLH